VAVERIARLSFTTADAARLAAFYVQALGAELAGVEERRDRSFGQLMGLEGISARALALCIGAQTIELLEFSTPGLPYPLERSSNDPLFQHIAIAVADMQAAFEHLAACDGWMPITAPAPQLLPPSSGGVRAFKFRDPEGHPLELLQFAPGREPPAWRAPSPRTRFLGINHSAIVVANTAHSIEFYCGLLGLSISSSSLNQGPEQERLDGLHGAVVEVTSLATRSGTSPHLELLCYRAPSPRRYQSPAPSSNDIAATRLVLDVDDVGRTVERLAAVQVSFICPAVVTPGDGSEAALLRDPDGHALLLRASHG
jgi:catechol 2,3-dioxygenase-like lactoylglutathione lyase family enzyme